MKNNIILPAMLLLASIALNAQDVAILEEDEPRFQFETVTLVPEELGNLTITCNKPEALTHLMIEGKDAELSFEWDGDHPADRFPMRLTMKPGKVKIRYKFDGGRWKYLHFKLEPEGQANVNLE